MQRFNPVLSGGRIEQLHRTGLSRTHKNASIRKYNYSKNRGFIAYSAIKMPAKPPRRNPLRTADKLSPMIGKILL